MNHDVQESLAYAKHLLAEHRRVHKLLADVDQKWSRTPGGPQAPGAIAELHGGVVELREELARHFEEEEVGGVLEEAAARCPNLGTEEIRLEEEHAVLLAEIDRIIAGIRTAESVGVVPADLKEAFKHFVKRLNAHEASENRVLARGFQMEIT